MSQIFLLALVAALFYWVYKSYSRYQNSEYSPKQFRSFVLTKEALAKSELGLFVALVAKVAKADGRIDELEAEVIGNMFNDISTLFPDPISAKTFLKEIFTAEKQRSDTIEPVARVLFELIRNDPHKRVQMMQYLVNLAYIDGTLSRLEEEMLTKIAVYLHFNAQELTSMLELFGSFHRQSFKESSLDHAYSLLNLTKSSSDEELKKAYRALVKQHHPDIIKAQGASEDYIQAATSKVQEINAAYELIKKTRGI
ncbi:MAG: TerB family tellurite resistance protein [Sulfuricurvum sp.]|uniref:TerB family tellurite resistance protein n=1 Tax=Sulfuricurvum sp. TaxID=2025608 RepID=UPI0025EEF18F|nr:TerB family tellurite resistance protein [Sulfuricurvum sp.]MCK9373253.1 TerB family tellurite resistance protein [Sulfuricurvum sp.]